MSIIFGNDIVQIIISYMDIYDRIKLYDNISIARRIIEQYPNIMGYNINYMIENINNDKWYYINKMLIYSYKHRIDIRNIINNIKCGITKSSILDHLIFNEKVKSAKLLLKLGIDPNIENTLGQNACFETVALGNLELLKLIKSYGGNLNIICKNKYTLLHITGDNIDMCKYLLDHGLDINSYSSEYYTPLYIACKYGYTNLVETLLKSGADTNCKCCCGNDTITPLAIACDRGYEKIVALLIKYGADTNFVSKFGISILIYAIKRGNIKIANRLLESGANVNHCDKSGNSILMYVCEYGNIDFVNLILKYKPNPFLLNNNQNTAMDIAIEKQYIDILELLNNYIN